MSNLDPEIYKPKVVLKIILGVSDFLNEKIFLYASIVIPEDELVYSLEYI